MSDDLVTFTIRYERSKFELKMKSPTDVCGFILKLKTELKIDDTEELVVLCPTPDGKMMEIASDDDIAFLKKTKLSYNSESKEIYCSLELVVTIIHKQLPDDPKFQMMVLSNKIDQLTAQFSQMSQSLNSKIEENTEGLLKNIKLFLQTDVGKMAETNCAGEQNNSSGSINFEPKTKKKPKKNKEKFTSTSYNTSSNDNLPKLNETINEEKTPVLTKNLDELLDMLVKRGFTNTIQNIIVLKRFDNDFEKALEYLNKSV